METRFTSLHLCGCLKYSEARFRFSREELRVKLAVWAIGLGKGSDDTHDMTSLVQVPRLLLRSLLANQKTQHLESDGRCLKFPQSLCCGMPLYLHLSKTLTFLHVSQAAATQPHCALHHWRDQVLWSEENTTGVLPHIPFHPRSREPLTNSVPPEQ